MSVLGWIALTVAMPLLVMALHGACPWLACHLVRSAARRLPAPYNHRYEEEWLAELAAMPDGGIAAVGFSICIWLGIGRMRRNLSASSVSRWIRVRRNGRNADLEPAWQIEVTLLLSSTGEVEAIAVSVSRSNELDEGMLEKLQEVAYPLMMSGVRAVDASETLREFGRTNGLLNLAITAKTHEKQKDEEGESSRISWGTW